MVAGLGPWGHKNKQVLAKVPDSTIITELDEVRSPEVFSFHMERVKSIYRCVSRIGKLGRASRGGLRAIQEIQVTPKG